MRRKVVLGAVGAIPAQDGAFADSERQRVPETDTLRVKIAENQIRVRIKNHWVEHGMLIKIDFEGPNH